MIPYSIAGFGIALGFVILIVATALPARTPGADAAADLGAQLMLVSAAFGAGALMMEVLS